MYDFNKVINRRTNALKWQVKEDELPMWVADMDFETANEITEALVKRAMHGIFGYAQLTNEWEEAIILWWKTKHGYEIKKGSILFSTGVIPSITSAIKRLTNVGDNVLVQTPVYDIFFHSIENHGRHVLENPLTYNGTQYECDFADLEKKLSNPLTTLMILCNPQNPTGRIWTKEELIRIGALCEKYHVHVISDEIHCDLVEKDSRYTPFLSASDACRRIGMMCASASKTFNLAGLQSSFVVIEEENLKEKINRGLNSDEIAEPNAFAEDAVIAAYTKGEVWQKELMEYITQNKQYVKEFCEKEIPNVRPIDSKATYLVWMDCSKVVGDTTEMCRYIRSKTGLYLSEGVKYRGNGQHFLRMNVACPKSLLVDGLERLKKGVEAYERWVSKEC